MIIIVAEPMKKILQIILTALFCFSVQLLMAEQPDTALSVLAKKSWSENQSHRFEPNEGQLTDLNGKPVPFVLFKAEEEGLQVYITNTGISYVFSEVVKEQENDSAKTINEHLHQYRMDAMLMNADIRKSSIELLEKAGEDYKNYFKPQCPDGIYRVFDYRKIRIRNIYPGINWLLFFTDEGLKYNFEVMPGADASLIKINFTGAEKIFVDAAGSLHLQCRMGTIAEQPPVSFQHGAEIKTKFLLNEKMN